MTLSAHIRVRPALPEDAAACQEIRYTAFRSGPMSQSLFPGEMSAAMMKIQTEQTRKYIEGGGTDKSRTHIVVAELMPDNEAGSSVTIGTGAVSNVGVPAIGTEIIKEVACTVGDAEASGNFGPPNQGLHPTPRLDILRNKQTGGMVIAFAKWHLYQEARPKPEWAVAPGPPTFEQYGEAANLEACDAFLGELDRMRARYIGGQPHVLLSLLACSPQHQRLGAGMALLQWGTKLADQDGLASWLEASPPGYSVYYRGGFRDVAVLDLDVTGRWGIKREDADSWGGKNAVGIAGEVPGRGWHRTVLMRRDPVAVSES